MFDGLIVLAMLGGIAALLTGIVRFVIAGYRGEPRRIRKRWTILFALLPIPLFSQGRYMFIQEPLWEAAHAGNAVQVEQLLRFGGDPNSELDDGIGSAFAAGIASGDVATVRVMLQHGADVDRSLYYFGKTQTALELADQNDSIRTLLRKAGAR